MLTTEVEEYDPDFPSVVVGDESDSYKLRKRSESIKMRKRTAPPSPIRTGKPHPIEILEMERYNREAAGDQELNQRHLKLSLQLARLEALDKCKNTPPEMKLAEIRACGQRIAFMEVGATDGCCRHQRGAVSCDCCKTGSLNFM
jgi:hypothetical protein